MTNYELCSFSNLSVTSPMSQLILQPFHRFTYVTAHSPTPLLLHLHHSSFSNPFIALPTSQFILQPLFCFSYVTISSLNSPGKPPMAWLPSSNPHKTETTVMHTLDLAAVHDGAPPHFSHQVRVACSDPFFEYQGRYPIDIHRQLCKVYGPQCMDIKKCAKVAQFMYGRTDVHDKQHSGQPSVSAKTVAKV